YYCDHSSDCRRHHCNAIAASTRASTRRGRSSSVGLLEDVARASRDARGPPGSRRAVEGERSWTQRVGAWKYAWKDVRPSHLSNSWRSHLDVAGQCAGDSWRGTGPSFRPRFRSSVVDCANGSRRQSNSAITPETPVDRLCRPCNYPLRRL